MEKNANLGSTESARALPTGEKLGQTIRKSLAVTQVVLLGIVLVLLAVGGVALLRRVRRH